MKKSLLKIICLLIIIGLNWTGLLAIGNTFAYFSDTEISSNNIYSVGTLDFSVLPAGDFSPEVKPGQNSFRTINLTNQGTLDFIHNVRVENATGTLCIALELKEDLTDIFQLLNSFSSTSTLHSAKSNWLFTAQLIGDNEALQQQACDFDLVFTGWQDNMPDPNQGFWDEERIASRIESGKWIIDLGDVVINELMWMGSRGSLGWGGEWREDEWIELRNTTNYPIDLSGWQITKLVGWGGNKEEKLMLEIPAGKIIAANSYFLISNFDKDNSRINIDPDLVDSSVDLRNRNLQIKLYKGVWQNQDNLIDTADDGNGRPLAGFRGFLGFLHFSMERKDTPGDGTMGSSWHTCWDDSAEMRAYWDPFIILGFSVNRGTPDGRNLSDYDEDILREYYQNLEEELLSLGLFIPELISDEGDYGEEGYDEEDMLLDGESGEELESQEEQDGSVSEDESVTDGEDVGDITEETSETPEQEAEETEEGEETGEVEGDAEEEGAEEGEESEDESADQSAEEAEGESEQEPGEGESPDGGDCPDEGSPAVLPPDDGSNQDGGSSNEGDSNGDGEGDASDTPGPDSGEGSGGAGDSGDTGESGDNADEL